MVQQERALLSDGVKNVASTNEARRVYRPVVWIPVLRDVEDRELEQIADP
jgi:hypothetical protein